MLGKTNQPLNQIFPFPIDIYNEEYIKLTSTDGYSFAVNKRAAIQSNYLKLHVQKVYDLPFTCEVLLIVIKYLYYKLRWTVGVILNDCVEIMGFPDIPEQLCMDVASAAELLQL